MTRHPTPRGIDERLWSRVEKGDEDWHCWEWTGASTKEGYGKLIGFLTRETITAHRLSYRLANKYPFEPEEIMHICDNPRCVNPLHLVGGTRKLNLQDAVRKRRMAVGGLNSEAKLTEAQVLAIRDDPRSQEAIARDYGIGQATVSRIKRRVSWKNLSRI